MQYLLLIHDRPDAWAKLSEAEAGAVMGEYKTFTDGLTASGAMRGGAPLDQSATLVRVRDGARGVSDGPYSSGPEHVNGYYLVEADSKDAALDVAAGIPSARFGTIEVRAVGSM